MEMMSDQAHPQQHEAEQEPMRMMKCRLTVQQHRFCDATHSTHAMDDLFK